MRTATVMHGCVSCRVCCSLWRFNNDGVIDLAVGLPAAVGVLFGNGDGTFDPVVMVPAGAA